MKYVAGWDPRRGMEILEEKETNLFLQRIGTQLENVIIFDM
jgi:hypothetical protein